MIDFLLGAATALGGVYIFFHFSGLPSLENRIKTMLSDALNDLKTAFEAAKDKAVADALAGAADAAPAAAQAQEATDEQAVRDFTAANFPQA